MRTSTNSRKTDFYFRLLKNLDRNTRRELMNRLGDSLKTDSDKSPDLASFFSVWDETRSFDDPFVKYNE